MTAPTSPLLPLEPGIAFWTQSIEGDAFYAAGWSELLGVESEPKTVEEWLLAVQAEEQLELATIIQRQFSAQHDGEFQLQLRRSSPGEAHLLLRIRRVVTSGGPPSMIVATSFDSVGRASLRRDGVDDPHHFRSVANAAPMLVWTTDVHGQCRWFNRTWLEFTGNSVEEALVQGRCGDAHPEDREPAISAFQAAFAQRDSVQLEFRLRHRDGSYRWVLDRSAPRFDAGGEFLGYVGVGLDITHEYEYRQRLCDRDQVMQQLHAISEGERTFMSCAIHDGLLQDIIGADMLLQELDQQDSARQVARLSKARETLRSAIRHGRRLIGELRPMILDERGLVSAIEFYAAELENRGSLKVVVVRNTVAEIDSTFWGGNVFRIVQAVLDNVESHSQSPQVTVEISSDDGQFAVVVRDDGVGFDLNAAKDSFGLRCICERAEIFGGSVSIVTAPGEGCTVSIQVPLPPLLS